MFGLQDDRVSDFSFSPVNLEGEPKCGFSLFWCGSMMSKLPDSKAHDSHLCILVLLFIAEPPVLKKDWFDKDEIYQKSDLYFIFTIFNLKKIN